MSHLFSGAGSYVLQSHIGGQFTVHNLEEGHLTNERVGDGLEYEDSAFAFGIYGSFLFVFAVDQGFNLACGGTREGVGDGVQQEGHAPQVHSAAGEYGNDGTVDDTLVQSFDGFFLGDFAFFEVLFQQFFAGSSQCFVQGFGVLFGNGFLCSVKVCFGSLALVVKGVSLLLDQVQEGNILAVLNGNQYGTNGSTELFAQLSEYAVEVGIGVVTLVDEDSLGNTGRFYLVPCQFGTDFHAGLAVQCNDGGVSYAYSGTNFTLEVQEAGGIDKVDFAVVPVNGSHGKGQRETALDFFCVVVTYGVAVGNLTHSVGMLCQIQSCFGDGSLTASAVAQQNNVPDALGVEICHEVNSFI